MIGQQGEQYNNEGRSFRKYILTIIFLFMLIIFLRKQKEEEQEEAIQKKTKANLRQNENYNRSYVFGYIRELSYLKYESVLYMSPNRTFLPITYYLDNNAIIYVEGYDNILRNSENFTLQIDEEDNYIHIYALPDSISDVNEQKDSYIKKTNRICVGEESTNDTCANINTVLVDKSLFKILKIASCRAERDAVCFFVFVQLQKKKCFNFTKLSYSCHANNLKNKNLFVMNNSCYVILTSSKLSALYDFIQNNILTNINFNETTKTQEVEIITHFCGNMLNQVAVIDLSNFRLLFMQRYIHINNKKETLTDNKQEDSDDKDEIQNAENEKIETDEVIDNYSMKEISYAKIREIYYITVIDLYSENKEIVEYVNYSKLKPQYTLFPPVYMGYDEQMNIYFIVNYENNGTLNIVFMSAESLAVYYTLRIQDFYSGWLLKPLSTYESKGLMFLGEYAPYEDELHIWNISNFHHTRYFVNTIKTDVNI